MVAIKLILWNWNVEIVTEVESSVIVVNWAANEVKAFVVDPTSCGRENVAPKKLEGFVGSVVGVGSFDSVSVLEKGDDSI